MWIYVTKYPRHVHMGNNLHRGHGKVYNNEYPNDETDTMKTWIMWLHMFGDSQCIFLDSLPSSHSMSLSSTKIYLNHALNPLITTGGRETLTRMGLNYDEILLFFV